IFHEPSPCLEAMGRLEHSVLTLDQGLRHLPGSPSPLLSRVIVMTKLRRPEESWRASDAYERTGCRCRVAPAHFYDSSILAFAATDRLTDAIRRADEGVARYPRNAPLLVHAARVHEARGSTARAAELYGRALEADAELPQARRGVADALYRAGHL